MRAGAKTSEFWLSLSAVILGALTTGGTFDHPDMPVWIGKVVGLAVSVLSAIGYTAARGIVKSNELKAKAASENVKAALESQRKAA